MRSAGKLWNVAVERGPWCLPKPAIRIRVRRCHESLRPRFLSSGQRRLTPLTLLAPRSSHALHHLNQDCRRRQSTSVAPHLEPTIYALSTAPGRAAIAVIRVSGPACTAIYHRLCPTAKPLKPRHAAVRSLYDPSRPPCADSLLDSSALLVHFPAPKTVTGEDVLELHVHGGIAVVRAVLAAIPLCATSAGTIRYAEPGEFTRRAFMNDRLDLTQVEALGDTLSASTEQQRRLSVRGTTNQLALRYETWRQQLLYARGELEALIDFSEDQHFDESPALLTASVADQVKKLSLVLHAHSTNAVRGELLRNGISLSLLGAPNAGKSSLLNRVVGRDAAIVSQEAGTTRDVVEVGIDLGGYLCRFGDTAGLRSVLDPSMSRSQHMQQNISLIEQEGMRRAKQRAEESDVVIVVLSLEIDNSGTVVLNFDPEVTETAARLSESRDNLLVVLNKIDRLATASFDLATANQYIQAAIPSLKSDQIFAISCQDAETSPDPSAGNIPVLLNGLVAKFEAMTSPFAPSSLDSADSEVDPSVWQESLGATERHRLLLDECRAHLQQFLLQVQVQCPHETSCGSQLSSVVEEGEVDIVLAAESLRAAATCLARITGKGEAAGDVEEVLGVVFEKWVLSSSFAVKLSYPLRFD